VPLKKAGNEFKACCPFHQERTPSFWVNDQKGFYHCFGCGVHGDVIRFLTDARGMSFKDAVQELADAVGLELPKASPELQAQQARSASLIEVMEAAAQLFQQTLRSAEGTEARAYLTKRDISEEARDVFRLGYAPDQRDRIKRELARFEIAQLIEAGLLIEVDERTPYDRFRGRVMVPIRDARGRVIAFGGRVLGDAEPKYLNSPDTPLFDKGRVLFNLDRAAPASRRGDRLIVVEGYMDVIALDQAGFPECVAPMGTALTEAQLEQLWRIVDQPVICFDGDAAGKRAAVKAAQRALASLRPGKHLAIALLPNGNDPDDLVRERGGAAFEAVVEQAQPLSTYLFSTEVEGIDRNRPEQRASLRHRLDELAQTCSDRFVAEEFSRSFRSLFYEEFGWKKAQRQAIASSVIHTSRRVRPELSRSFVRSTLYGLTRFPDVARSHLEALAAIPIAHPNLQRWRDAIAEAVLLNPALEEDGIQAIIAVSVLPETLQYDLTSDLRFGFTRRATERSKAVKQLETLLTFLAEERSLKEQLEELDKAAIEDAGGNRYEAIEAARQRLREERLALHERSADWDDDRSTL